MPMVLLHRLLGYEILGRIIIVMVPFVKGEKKAASGFAEEEDDFE